VAVGECGLDPQGTFLVVLWESPLVDTNVTVDISASATGGVTVALYTPATCELIGCPVDSAATGQITFNYVPQSGQPGLVYVVLSGPAGGAFTARLSSGTGVNPNDPSRGFPPLAELPTDTALWVTLLVIVVLLIGCYGLAFAGWPLLRHRLLRRFAPHALYHSTPRYAPAEASDTSPERTVRML